MVFFIIAKLEATNSAEENQRSDHPANWNSKKLKELEKITKDCIGVSCRKLSTQFDYSKSTITRKLVEIRLQYRKRQKVSKYSGKTAENNPTKIP